MWLLCRSIEPELYPRPDGTVYVCGEPAAVPVPAGGPAEVSLEKQALAVLEVRLTSCILRTQQSHVAQQVAAEISMGSRCELYVFLPVSASAGCRWLPCVQLVRSGCRGRAGLLPTPVE